MALHLPFLQHYRGLALFVILAGMSSLVMLSVYAGVQQAHRSSADDPQIEAAQEISDLLGQAIPAREILGEQRPIDMAKSLAVVAVIYDQGGRPVVSTGLLAGDLPTPPASAFRFARRYGETRFTWQPAPGIRLASVLRKADNQAGYVLVSRNLREVERRIARASYTLTLTWLGLLVLSAGVSVLLTVDFTGKRASKRS